MDELDERVDAVLSGIDDLTAELYALGGEDERFKIFEKLRELIQEKDQMGDDVAAAVLGWAYEELAN